jgi:hypothetical protein
MTYIHQIGMELYNTLVEHKWLLFFSKDQIRVVNDFGHYVSCLLCIYT